MDVIVALEHRFARTPDGSVWTATAFGREHWSRYLGTFARVLVLARVLDVPQRGPSWHRVDGKRVGVAPVPHYVGALAYLRSRGAVRGAIARAFAEHPRSAAILRVPGILGRTAAEVLRGAGRPFGVEVVGDPWEVFSPEAMSHPFRPFLRVWSTRDLRTLCAEAAAALYVTSFALQRRYPVRAGPAFAASNVDLPDEAFAAGPRDARGPGAPFRVVSVGTLEQLYKSPDVLIRALALAVEGGLDAELVLVGDGRHRAGLEALARRIGVGERVRFAGHLPSGEAVQAELDRADLFVLPSRTEGLPRALVEAMARGVPCLGTAVGGIPELLPANALVPCDAAAIGKRMAEVADSAARRAAMSRENLVRARAFHRQALQPIREAFQRQVAAATARSTAARGRAAPGGRPCA